MKAYLLPLGAICLLATACKPTPSLPTPSLPTPVPTPQPVKPTASFTAPDSVIVYGLAYFVNTSTHFSTGSWTWGDGSYPRSTDSLANPTVSQSYGQAGRYRVRLQVSNKNGSDTTSKVIRVVVPHLSATIVNSLAGSYYGTLYESYYVMSPGVTPHPNRPLVRDTLIQVTTMNNQLVAVPGKLGLSVPYYSATASWNGHKPERANYLFKKPYDSDTYTTVQKEQTGDSIYFFSRFGGLGSSHIFVFYGKRR